MNLRISSKAPTRIDLAGGTLDIWPLYLFLPHPITINLAINLFAEARLDQLSSASHGEPQGSVTLKSVDQKLEVKLSWQALTSGEGPTIPPGLELHYKLLRYFLEKKRRQGGLDFTKDFTKEFSRNLVFTTSAHSPAGAGLGGSSTLSIAMVGALATWASANFESSSSNGDAEKLTLFDPAKDGQLYIDVVRDVETTVIRVPAGLQDYYGAMYGGLQSLQWGTATHHREHLPEDLIHELQDRILLFYSGKSRNSGINNWTLFKDFIDCKNEVRSKFDKISSATHRLRKALLDRNWTDVGHAITEEWDVRKTLAVEITTPEIETAFIEAKKLTSVSGKICGAGGGGCFFIYLPIKDREERTRLKSQIAALFAKQEMRRLEFQGVPHGVEVTVHRES